ncbi:MAG: dockerin type I domain-containing protein [Chloroflexota bacterium]
MMKQLAALFTLGLLAFFVSPTHAQVGAPVTFPDPPGLQPGDAFGTAIAVDGNTAVVTAPNHDDGNGEPGAAYVYSFDGAMWTFEQELTPPDADGGRFGFDVDISGDLIAVGAPNDNNFTGAVYVFARENDTWSYEAKYTALDGEAGDAFGFSVALDGDTMAVGATGYDALAEGGGTLGSSGAVYPFMRTSGEFTPQPVLIPDDIVAGGLLGFSVDVGFGGISIIAGAPFANNDTGVAYRFRKFASSYNVTERLEPQTAATGNGFGWDVAFASQTNNASSQFDNGMFAVSSYMNGNSNPRFVNLYCDIGLPSLTPTGEVRGSGQFGESIGAAKDAVFVSASDQNRVLQYFASPCGQAFLENTMTINSPVAVAATDTQVLLTTDTGATSSRSYMPLDCPQATTVNIAAGDVDALIRAMNCANRSPEDNEINIVGVYTLTEIVAAPADGLPVISEADGAGKLSLNGTSTIRRNPAAPNFRILTNLGDLTLNAITLEGGMGYYSGGAIFNYNLLTINDSQFNNNTVIVLPESETDAAEGGAIFNSSGELFINRSVFSGNSAYDGGAVHASDLSERVEIRRTTFTGNAAEQEAGVLYSDGGQVEVASSLMYGNTGLSTVYSGGGPMTIVNSTIASNAHPNSESLDAVVAENGSILNFENSIVWNAEGNTQLVNRLGSATINVTNSIIFGDNTPDPENLNVDPQFVNPGADNYRLSVGSPAINAGDNAATNDANLTEDFAGTPRIVDGTVDIGAFEFVDGSPLALYDVNGDNIISASDAMYVINRIGQPIDPDNAAADVNGNGQIDQADAAGVIAQIGQTVAP